MKKSDINPMPPKFAKYIDLVADVELEQAFHDSNPGAPMHHRIRMGTSCGLNVSKWPPNYEKISNASDERRSHCAGL